MTASISDTYIANNNGPRTLPCGTPDDSVHVLDFSDPIATYCVRSDTSDFTQLSAYYTVRLSPLKIPTEKSLLLEINFYNLWPLRLGEEKKEEETNHRAKIKWPALLHRVAITRTIFQLILNC